MTFILPIPLSGGRGSLPSGHCNQVFRVRKRGSTHDTKTQRTASAQRAPRLNLGFYFSPTRENLIKSIGTNASYSRVGIAGMTPAKPGLASTIAGMTPAHTAPHSRGRVARRHHPLGRLHPKGRKRRQQIIIIIIIIPGISRGTHCYSGGVSASSSTPSEYFTLLYFT